MAASQRRDLAAAPRCPGLVLVLVPGPGVLGPGPVVLEPGPGVLEEGLGQLLRVDRQGPGLGKRGGESRVEELALEKASRFPKYY